MDGLEAIWNRQPPWVMFIVPQNGTVLDDSGDSFVEDPPDFPPALVVNESDGPMERYELIGRGIDGSPIDWSYWHESRNDAIHFFPDETRD